jgi:hypothetical protein
MPAWDENHCPFHAAPDCCLVRARKSTHLTSIETVALPAEAAATQAATD